MVAVGHKLFRMVWRGANVALVAALLALVYSAGWEYSVRRYLMGFSDAIIPANATPEERVEAILDWMREGPPRSADPTPGGLAIRDPETTLNYRQLLGVCGTATNAFLNLAHTSDLQVRRLLLLSADRTAKHVVAEVLINGRWIVVDPTYRTIMRNAKGEMLTRKELQDPQVSRKPRRKFRVIRRHITTTSLPMCAWRACRSMVCACVASRPRAPCGRNKRTGACC